MHSVRVRFAFAAALAQFVLPIALAVTMLVCASAQNLVVNGSFEEPDIGSATHWLYWAGSSMPGWLVTQGDIELTATDWSPHYDGKQSIDLNGNRPGGLAQSVSIPTAGPYRLQFAMSSNPFHNDTNVRSMDVTFGSLFAGQFLFDPAAHPGHALSNMQWDMHRLVIEVPAPGTYTLSFVSTFSVYAYRGCGPVIDSVSLTLVPEPASLAVLGTGLFGLLTLRRRKR